MIIQKIKVIMQEIFEIDSVPDDISQKSCDNWDSLRHLALAVAIEETFNISLEPEEIEQMTSIQAITKIVGEKH
jgi:acyl carrier protein